MAKVCMSNYDPAAYINYERMQEKVEQFRKHWDKPLTYAEKILFGHLDNPDQEVVKQKSYLYLRPDRVAMQDATAQMAILQFMSSGIPHVAVPTTVHADHLIAALDKGGKADLEAARETNKEVYDFLRGAAAKYGMGYWGPGSGIIHQLVFENYAFPGGMMIGTDSHTPNAGGMGMIAVGIGGADAVDVMAGLPLELKAPKIIGIHVTGKMGPWVSPKDIILYVAGQLTVSGGTDCIIEYYGPGVEEISCTGQATICNMGAEVGATCSIFPYNRRQDEFLRATNRVAIADHAKKFAGFLRADEGCVYDKIVELNLSELSPHINGPASPDRATPLPKMAEHLAKGGWKDELLVCLIGSCTNSSYEDLSRAAEICKQCMEHGTKIKTKFYISPGSEQIRATIERDGIADIFRAVGGVILANACGPCIGQWKRTDIDPKSGFKNSILHSYNRNFVARADGNKETHAFIGSPAIVTALAFGGRLTFDPRKDMLVGADGKEWLLTAPVGSALPKGDVYAAGENVYEPPAADGSKIVIPFKEGSERLAPLKPFAAWDHKDYTDCPILIKIRGKCTTDHISQAGPWLKFRGHIDNISNNLFLTAVNDANGKQDCVKNQITGEFGPVAATARAYKAAGLKWVVIGDSNYGEGSSREHAAIEPRHLGGVAIITRSFARIHESNLKKQGVLALTFVDPADYDKITGDDRISLLDLEHLAEGKTVDMLVKPASGAEPFVIKLKHTLNASQIEWFQAGSALNKLAASCKQ